MARFKSALLVGAGVATIGLSSFGVAAAATNSSSTSPEDSLVQKIASKFSLNKADVQAVFDEEHSARMADMQADRAAALKQAVTDKKLTQAQADHITAAWKAIDDLRGTTKPRDLSDTTRQQIKDKMDELKTWLDDQNIDLKSIDGLRGPGMGGHGPGGFGGPGRMDSDSDDTSSTN